MGQIKKIRITILNANQCELDGDRKILMKLYEMFCIKHPNWFQIMRHMRGKSNWDGYIKYISERGRFSIGLLPFICSKIKDLGGSPLVIDNRKDILITPKIPKKIGDKILRPEQLKALESLLSYKVGDNELPFYIGVGDLSVNFGKSLLFAALYIAFKKQVPTILLTNDKDWLEQAKKEFKELIPEDELNFVQGGKVIHWKNFTIAMVQSLARNIDTYQYELAKKRMVLIDEADLIDNAQYKTVLKHLYNTYIRIGLSGTIYMSKLKKHLIKNLNIRSFIGNKITEYRLKEMMDKGYSTQVTVRMLPYPFPIELVDDEDYSTQYDRIITNNKKAWKFSLARTNNAIAKGRLPALIVCKKIAHCENLYKYYCKKLPSLKITYVHVDVRDRKKRISDFRDGKYDILIATTLIARGKNMPLIKYQQNTSSMDSNEKSIQLLGRLVRTSDNKRRGYYEDLMFPGRYLARHAKHRKNYYKKEQLKVIVEKL